MDENENDPRRTLPKRAEGSSDEYEHGGLSVAPHVLEPQERGRVRGVRIHLADHEVLAPGDPDRELPVQLVVEAGGDRETWQDERVRERVSPGEAVDAALNADVRHPAEDVDHVRDAHGAVVDRRWAVARAVVEVPLLIGGDDDAARLDGEVPLVREAVGVVETAADADARRRLALDREDAERRGEP